MQRNLSYHSLGASRRAPALGVLHLCLDFMLDPQMLLLVKRHVSFVLIHEDEFLLWTLMHVTSSGLVSDWWK